MYDPRADRRPSALRATAAFGDGRDGPRAYLERRIEVIDRREGDVRAFASIDLAAARRAADESAARYRAGRPRSPLDGWPVGLKDIIETRDLPTRMGSPLYAGWQAGRDAACAHALRRAGAVIVGKTVTTEFACGTSGPTRNPWDPARTPGASSSGSGAAVGAGMVPVALGTQTQASLIRPASYCGVVGFKPTFGALHVGGIHPLAASQDHLGVLAETLEDAWVTAHLLGALAGPTPGFAGLAGPAEPPAPVAPRRLVRLATRGWEETDEASRQAFEAAMSALRARGVEIAGAADDPEVRALEAEIAAANDLSRDVMAYEMRWPMLAYLSRGPDALGERLRGFVARGEAMRPADYEAALARRDALRRRWAAVAERADGVVTLASSGPAPVGLELTGSRTFAIPATLAGAPALSLPLLASGGLPLGLQVIGFAGRDAAACALGAWIATALQA